MENILAYSSNLKLSSANSFNLKESKICRLGKGKGLIKSYMKSQVSALMPVFPVFLPPVLTILSLQANEQIFSPATEMRVEKLPGRSLPNPNIKPETETSDIH